MVVLGRVQNGVVVLEGDLALPEGTVVTVSCGDASAKPVSGLPRVEVPLVKTGRPGSIQLSGEQIAQVMDEEDAAP